MGVHLSVYNAQYVNHPKYKVTKVSIPTPIVNISDDTVLIEVGKGIGPAGTADNRQRFLKTAVSPVVEFYKIGGGNYTAVNDRDLPDFFVVSLARARKDGGENRGNFWILGFRRGEHNVFRIQFHSSRYGVRLNLRIACSVR